MPCTELSVFSFSTPNMSCYCSHPLYRESELIEENCAGMYTCSLKSEEYSFICTIHIVPCTLLVTSRHLLFCSGVRNAAQRKLFDELGIVADELPVDQFIPLGRMLYKAPSDGKWGEHELDYLLFMVRDVKLDPNPEEVADVKYMNRHQLKELLRKADAGEDGVKLSPWFRLVVDNFLMGWWDHVEQGTLQGAADMKTIHKL
uniref:Nudix hydrolase domain-containing protein n=1 Tax=Zea mays TaxID=4577 RepID=A0A804Q0U3_MAIZE